jgi:prepilin-type N-terminal cleavage/methylation domain-containing protein
MIIDAPKYKKGFTLMETLVAISILMLAIAGPLTVAQKGLSGAAYAKDQITAYYLAQDAVEFVRSVRDTNALRGYTGNGSSIDGDTQRHWLTGLADCAEDGGCIVDSTDFSDIDTYNLVETCGSACPELQYLATDNGQEDGNPLGLYGYAPLSGGTGWKPSGFTRSVYLARDPAFPDIATVTVKVAWVNGTLENEVVLKDFLTKRY